MGFYFPEEWFPVVRGDIVTIVSFSRLNVLPVSFNVLSLVILWDSVPVELSMALFGVFTGAG